MYKQPGDVGKKSLVVFFSPALHYFLRLAHKNIQAQIRGLKKAVGRFSKSKLVSDKRKSLVLGKCLLFFSSAFFSPVVEQ